MRWDMLEMPRAGKSHGRVTSPPGSSKEPGGNSACAMNCHGLARHPSEAAVTPGPGPALGCPGTASLGTALQLIPRRANSPAVPCLSFPSVQWAQPQRPKASVGPGMAGRQPAGPGQGGCHPGCTFGLNPGVPPCTETSKNNRPERGANHRLFIARHP